MEYGPKYSIIIPSKSGMPYLKYSVNSVLSSQFIDLELIVSLDDTGDESFEFLSQITDTRLKVIGPPSGLSMSEHWDFAQSHALGRWQMFLGQDDMMMNGFLEAFEYLTDLAQQSELGVIVARRAYVCWPPLKHANLKALQYWRTDEISIKESNEFVPKALLSEISYHAGPQMYTTTLVSRSVVDSIRIENQGRLILGHPQDAYLAVALLKKAPSFLFSGQPFSWVGTSSKSAGLAITKMASGEAEYSQLANDYRDSVQNSKSISYNSKTDFRHGINARYFLDALQDVWPEVLSQKPLSSTWFRLRVDAKILSLAAQTRALQIDRHLLLLSAKFFILRYVFSKLLTISRLVGHKLTTIASMLLQILRPKSLMFRSTQYIENADKLFELAMKLISFRSK